MSARALTLSFAQTRLRTLLVLGAALGGGGMLGWHEQAEPVPLQPTPVRTLPPKAPPQQAVLLQGARQHPWRLFALLQDSQVAGVRLQTLAWAGAGKPLQLAATAEQFTQIQAWQAKLGQSFGAANLRDVAPGKAGNALLFHVEVTWSR